MILYRKEYLIKKLSLRIITSFCIDKNISFYIIKIARICQFKYNYITIVLFNFKIDIYKYDKFSYELEKEFNKAYNNKI